MAQLFASISYIWSEVPHIAVASGVAEAKRILSSPPTMKVFYWKLLPFNALSIWRRVLAQAMPEVREVRRPMDASPTLMNKGNPKSNETEEVDTLRERTARQLKDSEEAAKEVADLCAKAAEKARRHHLPHAGMGSTHPAQD